MSRLKSAFTLVELLVTVSIMGILAALIVPLSSKGILAASKADSINNLRQIYLMTLRYTQDNNNILPPAYSPDGLVWFTLIADAPTDLGNPPANRGSGPFATLLYDRTLRKQYPNLIGPNYAMNMMGLPPASPDRVRWSYIEKPSTIVLYSLASPLEWGPAWFGYGNGMAGTGWPSRPYNNTSLICFVDGHTEVVKANPSQPSGLDLKPENWVPPAF